MPRLARSAVSFSRLPRMALIGLLAWAATGVALATDETPEHLLNGYATLDSRYLPYSTRGTGEVIDLYSGSLGFVVTDASLPGSSGLDVAVTRRFETGSPGDSAEAYELGDWQLDVPVIEGVVSDETLNQQDGWRSSAGSGSGAFDRCSNFGTVPSIGTPFAVFDADEYWDGFHLHVPGAGSQLLLGRGSANPHAPTAAIGGHSSFQVVTKQDWMVACLSSLDGSQLGEGFYAVSPDGRRFTFNHLVYRPTQPVSKPADGTLVAGASSVAPTPGSGVNPDAPVSAELPRERALMYATRVDDRFGHYVNYTFDPAHPDELTRIQADDGRRIDLVWSNGRLDHVTAQPQSSLPRTWHYVYGTVNGHVTLQQVTLPDATHWSYGLSGLAYAALGFSGGNCIVGQTPLAPTGHAVGGNPAGAPVTTPGGMQVTYTVAATARGHADTPSECKYPGSSQVPGTPLLPETYAVFAVQTKVASGAGLPSRTWTYTYSAANGSWSTQCTPTCPASTVWTQVKDPEGRTVKYTWSNVYDETEGQLQAVEYRNTATGAVVRSEARQYAAATAGPWPTSYGYGSTERSNFWQEGAQTPLKKRTTTEGGISYTWTANSFDTYTEPLTVVRASSGTNAQSVSETLAWYHNTALWVLGQPQSTTVTAPSTYSGLVPELRSYNTGNATLSSIRHFGHQVAAYTWYTTGATAGQLEYFTDGNIHSTTYSNYSYEVPRTISYADSTHITLGVNDFGEVTSVTDELNHVTGVTRDSLGRITQKTFPTDSGNTWYPVNVSYQPIATSEYGVSGTHWRVTATQGNRADVTVYDAALNPVLTSSRDTGTSQGSMTWRQYRKLPRQGHIPKVEHLAAC